MTGLKKCFAIIFSIMAVTLMNSCVFAAVQTYDGFKFDTETGAATITGAVTKDDWASFRTANAEAVKSIGTVSGAVLPYDCSFFFHEMTNCESIDLSNANTSKVNDMSYMFFRCSALKTINFGNIDTSQVTSMHCMFESCSALTALDLSKFDTSRVTSMGSMFAVCSSLTSLDLSTFDTSRVQSMSYMFSKCKQLKSINFGSKFITSHVSEMEDMFYYCEALETLDLGFFDTSNVCSMRYMFAYCKGLTSLNVKSFKTNNVERMDDMFYACSNLETLDVSSFNTKNVTDMAGMFSSCNKLKTLDVSGFNTENVTDMTHMFSGCIALETLDVSDFDTTNVTSMRNMFYNCRALKSLNVRGFNTGSCTDMTFMFYYCTNVEALDVSRFDTSKVTNMTCMFSSCSKLKTVDISSFDLVSAKGIAEIFGDCVSLTSVNAGCKNTGNITNMSRLFKNCPKLTSLDLSTFDTSSVNYCDEMLNCESLHTLKLGPKFTLVKKSCKLPAGEGWVRQGGDNALITGEDGYAVIENNGTYTYKKRFKATFYAGKHGSSPESVIAVTGSKFTQPADPTDDSSAFAGWYTDPALSKPYDFGKTVTKSIVLYGRWSDTTKTVDFVKFANDGQTSEKTIYYGNDFTVDTGLDEPCRLDIKIYEKNGSYSYVTNTYPAVVMFDRNSTILKPGSRTVITVNQNSDENYTVYVKYKQGDLTGNGDIEENDALVLIKGIDGAAPLDGEQLERADANGDQAVDMRDVITILQTE